MKKISLVLACVLLSSAMGVIEASAQGRSGHGAGPSFGSNPGSSAMGLNRADQAAGPNGMRGRRIARAEGANRRGFCPPGQAKKPGKGSRFMC